MTRSSKLFLISFLILFLEVSLIRFVGTEVRLFAYFHNLVLLGCFIGFGLGCLYSSRPSRPEFAILLLAILLLAIELPINIHIAGQVVHLVRGTPELLSVFDDSGIWYSTGASQMSEKVLLGLLSTFVIFMFFPLIFFPLGQIMGDLLTHHPRPLAAYSINVVGSLVGLFTFSALSNFFTSPWVCFLIFGTLMVPFLISVRSRLLIISVFAIFFSAIGWTASASAYQTVWSPYQKLQLLYYRLPGQTPQAIITVNNVGYMTLLDLSDSGLRNLKKTTAVPPRQEIQYDLPFFFKQRPEQVLIVGAGGGNDAAGALRNGAGSITGIEIDPGVIQLGRAYHPEHPYANPRVKIIENDARAFFKRSHQRFDLIIFGLLDAHTQSSSLNNTRLDHYVYTLESFQEVRRLLKDDGVLSVAFSPQRPWIGARLAELLQEAFQSPPLVFHVPGSDRFGWGGTLYIEGKDPKRVEHILKSNPALQHFVQANQVQIVSHPPLTTDDWPYLYLQHRKIPRLQLCVMGIILLAFVGFGKAMWHGSHRLNLHFFFLGAGFLLLEFQNISKSSLLFGSTWQVNVFTLATILCFILLANLTVARARFDLFRWGYMGLAVSLLGLYLTPVGLFNTLPFPLKVVLANLFLNVPIYFAGLIFTSSFAQTDRKDIAFGSNLLGAATGGLLESLSFITGIQALILVTGALYLISALTRKNNF